MNFDISRTEQRIKNMSEGQLISWLEVALPGMQRHLEAYVRSRSLDHLGELAIAETTANLVVTEMLERKFAQQSEVESVVSASQAQPDTTSARGSFLRRRRARTGTAPATTAPTTTTDSPTKNEQSPQSASGQ